MAVAAPKIALHLYLNNPYGLLSAVVPNYTANAIDVENGSKNISKHQQPLPSIVSSPENDEYHLSDLSPSQEITRSKFKKPLPNIPSPETNVPKSTRGSPDTTISRDEGQTSTSPALGFTWSLNLEKRNRRPLILRKPPPPTLLEKLGRLKLGEPVGVVKMKKGGVAVTPTSYNIQKLQLNDKRQRKMASKLSEWLDQYNDVSLRQQEYLKRIQNLRKGLENKKEKNVIVSIDQVRTSQNKYHRKYPLYTMKRMEDAAVNQGPAPFPNRPCFLHADEKSVPHKTKASPNGTPRKLAPIIIKRVKPNKSHKSADANETKSSPRPDLTKMRTEYEPFESIAKRNKLSLTHFFNSSLSHRRVPVQQRMPMMVSTVTIINEVQDENSPAPSPVDYITDISSKKAMSVNKVKDDTPG